MKRTFVLVAILLAFTSAQAQETGAETPTLGTRLGLYAAGALNFNDLSVLTWQVSPTQNPLFERWYNDSLRFTDGEMGLSFVGGGLVGIPISDVVHFTGRLGVNWLNASSSVSQPLTQDSTLQHAWSASIINLEVMPGVEIHNFIDDVGLYLLGGLELGIAMTSSREQFTDLYVNNAYLAQQVTTGPTEIPNTTVRAAIAVGVGYDINLSKNIWLQPEVSYRLPLTDVSSAVSHSPWSIGQLRFGVNLTFDISSKKQAPPADRPELGARIGRVTALDRNGAEYDVTGISVEDVKYTEMFPLVPYVFYPEKGSEPGADLQAPAGSEEGGFSPEALSLDAVEVNKNLLNIVGSRMQNIPQSTLTITGTTDGMGESRVPELGNRRATWAKDYLVKNFKIDPSRISVQSTDKPSKPSSSTDPDGIVENRRIELSSNVPDVLAPLTLTAEDQRLANPDVVTFHPVVENADSVAGWTLQVKQAGRPLKEFNGRGTPEKISWAIKPNDLSTTQVPVDYEFRVRDGEGREASGAGSVPVDYLSSVQKKTENLPDKTIDKYSLILFDFDKSDLTEENQRILERAVLPSIKSNSKVSIIGYTDRIGSDTHNKKLSSDRAATVKSVLSSKAKDAQYTAVGVGESAQIFSNDSPIGRHLSRTVQVIVETPRR